MKTFLSFINLYNVKTKNPVLKKGYTYFNKYNFNLNENDYNIEFGSKDLETNFFEELRKANFSSNKILNLYETITGKNIENIIFNKT